ncbi:MAG: SDR family oxidoreductase [Actinomycetota bacterium]|nr:SDR family oxidoreductase [Actinomycetota bacterium]
MTCVIVTGGSTGIGLQIARRLGAEGTEVVLVARNPDRLGEAADALGSEGIACRTAALDVRDGDAVNDLVGALPQVDGLVNNAAGNFVSPAVDMSLKGFRAVVEISLYGTFNFSTAVARRLMAQRRGGSMCNIIATYAWTGAPGVSHSAAAKAGMLAFTKSVAREWGEHGIRVNAVAPGFVPTQNATANILSDPATAERMRDLIPLGRFGQVDEIADAVSYLMSERASYITGSVLTVDGGRSLGISMHATRDQARS